MIALAINTPHLQLHVTLTQNQPNEPYHLTATIIPTPELIEAGINAALPIGPAWLVETIAALFPNHDAQPKAKDPDTSGQDP